MPDTSVDLDALESALAPLSHGDRARTILREALAGLNTKARLDLLDRSLVRRPIRHEDVCGRLAQVPEYFTVLQGDVICTDAAYVLGTRRTGNPSYVVATSTCDTVPGRRKTVTLLQVEAKTSGYKAENDIKSELALLTKFQRTDYFYLPRLPDDEATVLFNVAHLDATAQCMNQDLSMSQRRASMTLIGWRVFGALLRTIQIREAAEEVSIRRLQ